MKTVPRIGMSFVATSWSNSKHLVSHQGLELSKKHTFGDIHSAVWCWIGTFRATSFIITASSLFVTTMQWETHCCQTRHVLRIAFSCNCKICQLSCFYCHRIFSASTTCPHPYIIGQQKPFIDRNLILTWHMVIGSDMHATLKSNMIKLQLAAGKMSEALRVTDRDAIRPCFWFYHMFWQVPSCFCQ